jgi:hypothetical protein
MSVLSWREMPYLVGGGLLEAGVAGAAAKNERGQRDDRSNQTTHVSLPLVLVSAL